MCLFVTNLLLLCSVVYKKHYPRALHDEVWRLDRIAKDGALHKKLIKAEIVSVEDFLRLLVKDPQRLRSVSICSYLPFFQCCSIIPFICYIFHHSYSFLFCNTHNPDPRKRNVQHDVGKHSGACQNMCLWREALCLLNH